ncbi:hypothetical protein [Sphaerisporangium fuscum]|uniref:hypothetical protein n=1 Tax=Sphaerisporangium fuscum TaxID=2835868 RepID=UPI001BDCEF2F|nr:hypothetical protein [Sphaerisporangium fuscum]
MTVDPSCPSKPVPPKGTARPGKYCSRRCTNAASNARQKRSETTLAARAAQLAELTTGHAPALQQLLTGVTAELNVLNELREELLRRNADLEREAAEATAEATDAERRGRDGRAPRRRRPGAGPRRPRGAHRRRTAGPPGARRGRARQGQAWHRRPAPEATQAPDCPAPWRG